VAVKPRAPGKHPAAASKKSDDKHVRLILPSGRVAEFKIPRVGEVMAIREVALAASGGDVTDLIQADGKPKLSEFAMSVLGTMQRQALRRLLVGITERPVEPIAKPGFNFKLVREQAETHARDEIEKELAAEAEESGDDLAMLMDADQVADRVAVAGDKAVIAAIDDDATAKTANLVLLNDLEWDTGQLMRQFPDSYPGTPEAADWEALHVFAQRLLSANLGTGGGGPKASSSKESPRPILRSGVSVVS
jgi:hypothetical protein